MAAPWTDVERTVRTKICRVDAATVVDLIEELGGVITAHDQAFTATIAGTDFAEGDWIDKDGHKVDTPNAQSLRYVVPQPASVAVVSTSGGAAPSSMQVGATITVAARITLDNGDVGAPVSSDPSITWKSSASAVATITQAGVIKGVAAGSTSITAIIGGITSPGLTVTVTPIPVTGVTVSPTSLALETGAQQNIAVTVAPSNAGNKTFTAASSDATVATATVSGTNVAVKALKAGTAKVTVTTTDGARTAAVNVTVTEPAPPAEG